MVDSALLEPVFPPFVDSSLDEVEREIRAVIADLQRRHAMELEPWFKRLPMIVVPSGIMEIPSRQ